MKITIDLPANLVRKLKLRAAHDGRKMREIAADILRSGLAAPSVSKKSPRPTILKDKKTGLPVIQCGRAPARDRQLPPEDVASLLNEQESQWAAR